MKLKNKRDGKKYLVSTEEDGHRGFVIFASLEGHPEIYDGDFCMHYRSLAEFLDDWEDA